jgi:hypothetical protein
MERIRLARSRLQWWAPMDVVIIFGSTNGGLDQLDHSWAFVLIHEKECYVNHIQILYMLEC